MLNATAEIKGAQNLIIFGKSVVRVEPPIHFKKSSQFNSSTTLGAFSNIKPGVVVSCAAIGRYCSIATGVRIGDHEHPTSWLSLDPPINGVHVAAC